MSVVLDRPVDTEQLTVADVPVALRTRVPLEPVRRPVVDVPVVTPNRARVRQDVGVKVARIIGLKAMLFGVVFEIRASMPWHDRKQQFRTSEPSSGGSMS